ncbi:hypothetical protein D0867_11567 [Hortaea werneckii]|uniref:Transcription initiation factor TFIID subunit 12 domain-containing protein n=1 Tax=Hortaea werneckii TaxID=91943 RepID=A0A3M6YD29_HORWE|nr:hypothetical protein D0867_11567 [Hortaea werneckii]
MGPANVAMSQMLIKPEQIDNLPFLEPDKKQRYKQGLNQLWQQYDGGQVGTPQRQQAEEKIRSVSRKLMEEMAAHQRQKNGPQQGQPNQPTQQPAGQNGQMQRPPTAGGMGGGAGAGGAGGVPQANNMQQGAPQQQQQPTGGQSQMVPWIQREVSSVNIHIPHNIQPAQASAYRQKWLQHAITELQKKESANSIGKQLQPTIKDHQQKGTQAPPEVMQKWEAAKRTGGQMKQGQAQTSNSPAQAQPNFQQPQPPAVNQPAPSAPTPGMNPQQQPQGVSTPQPPPAQTPQTATQSHPPPPNFPQQQVPQSQQQIPQQPQQQQPQHQYGQQPQRPPFNQQHVSQQQVQQTPGGQPQPMVNRANSAGPQQPGQQRPQALSQQAAVAQAAQAYQNQQAIHQQQAQQGMAPNQQQGPPGVAPQQPGQPQHPGQQMVGGGGPGPQYPGGPQQQGQPTPTSAGGFGVPPGHTQHQPPSMQATTTPNNKFPIPKQLHINSQINQQVQGPPSRPTMANAGMVSQPGLQRPAAYTLEGEGDRVLSKRKLDELVRQVTGGGSTSSSTTDPEHAFLDPLVEENVLALADDFVDSVITSACKLAKLRPNQMLELRDVQMVLERNWGIRVPGYTLEEVRAVKRFQPTVEWQKKMGAVGTAKTLGGVGKNDS